MRKNRRRRSSHRVRANRRKLRRLVRNLLGVSVVSDVVVPTLGAVAGYIGGRMLANALTETTLPVVGGNAMAARYVAALGGAIGTGIIGRKVDVIGRHSGAIITGMGVMAVAPVVMPYVDGMTAHSAPTAPTAPTGTSGLSAYYSERSLRGGMYDVSHAGAPYKGMLGLGDPADQGAVDSSIDDVEGISTVEPTDVARMAKNWDPTQGVTETMAGSPGDRGYAGGTFARNLFSGMMGG